MPKSNKIKYEWSTREVKELNKRGLIKVAPSTGRKSVDREVLADLLTDRIFQVVLTTREEVSTKGMTLDALTSEVMGASTANGFSLDGILEARGLLKSCLSTLAGARVQSRLSDKHPPMWLVRAKVLKLYTDPETGVNEEPTVEVYGVTDTEALITEYDLAPNDKRTRSFLTGKARHSVALAQRIPAMRARALASTMIAARVALLEVEQVRTDLLSSLSKDDQLALEEAAEQFVETELAQASA